MKVQIGGFTTYLISSVSLIKRDNKILAMVEARSIISARRLIENFDKHDIKYRCHDKYNSVLFEVESHLIDIKDGI